MSVASNRELPLLGEEPTKVDKLGNSQPIEPDVSQLLKRSEQKKAERRARLGGAVSPPDRRRGRDKGAEEAGGDIGRWSAERERESDNGPLIFQVEPPDPLDVLTARRRQFERHGANGGRGDSQKRVNQGWGHLPEAQQLALYDELDPADPAAEPNNNNDITMSAEDESNLQTLDEYKATRIRSAPREYGRREPRAADVGDLSNLELLHGPDL